MFVPSLSKSACLFSVCGAWEKPDFSCLWGTAETSSPSHHADLQYHTWNKRLLCVCVLCTWQINILTLWSCTFQGQSMLCGWVWINTCSAQPGWDETSCAVGISNATVTYSAFPFGVIQTLQEIYKRGNIARHSFVLRLDSTLTLYLCICSLKTHTKFA